MNFFDKLKDIVGLNDQDDYDYEYDDVDNTASVSQTNSMEDVSRSQRSVASVEPVRSKTGNVIGMPGMAHGASEMILIEPQAFEEMPQVIDALRQRKSVILNMTLIRQEEAQRAVDFVAGGTYAIDGHYERIGDNIFLFTPSCVQVSTPSTLLTEAAPAPVRTARTVASNTWMNEPIAAVQ